jgi:RNA polymerase sigma-70 factor (ECF subfamily)
MDRATEASCYAPATMPRSPGDPQGTAPASTAGVADAEFVARFQGGDERAFEALVRRHEPSVRRLVARYVRNEADTKDVAQEAFTRAFQALTSFRGDSTFRTWLYRIAVNVALDHVRGNPKRETFPIEDVTTFTHSLQTSRLVAAEVWHKVSARLDALPPKQRLVFELRMFHDLSFEEVAALAECSEDSAKVNYHYAVKRLRDLLPKAP